jgi:hypothetical protein
MQNNHRGPGAASGGYVDMKQADSNVSPKQTFNNTTIERQAIKSFIKNGFMPPEINESFFYDTDNKIIVRAIHHLIDDHTPIRFYSVSRDLADYGQYKAAYIIDLMAVDQ